MKTHMSKTKFRSIPFEPAGENSQKFFEKLASMPSTSNGRKTDPTSINRLVEQLNLDK